MNTCDTCKAQLVGGPDDGGAQPAECRGCGTEVCDNCAPYFDVDGGYGPDGSGVRIKAYCEPCYAHELDVARSGS